MRASLVGVFVCMMSGVALAQEAGGAERAEAEKAAPEAAAPEKLPSSSGGSPRRAPTWSMGAGVGLGGVTVGLPIISSSTFVTSYLLNQANLTFERSIGPADWFFFDLVGSYNDSSSETKRDGYSSGAKTESSAKAAGALVGLRHVFSASQWVDVSGWVGASFSWAQYETSTTPATGGGLGSIGNPKHTTEFNVVSGQVGLALDREIVPGLAVRLSVPVLQAMHAWGVDRQKDIPDDNLTASGFGLHIAPSLEVHMQF